jgi:RNA polymerase sigma-70 factor, ECF subfamily
MSLEPPPARPSVSLVRRRVESAGTPSPGDRIVMAVNSRDGRASNREAREADAEIDRALIQRAQAGDMPAFRELVQRHQRRAFGIAVALVKDEEDAREIVQEAFIRVFRGLAQFHGGSSFFTWLYRIVHNLSIDVIRKPSRRETELDALTELDDGDEPPLARPGAFDPLEAVQHKQIQQRIQAALDALPAYHRGVIVMREVYGMSYDEMAESMGVSKGTIMSRLFHARRKLQRVLAECYEEAFGREPPASGDDDA